MRRMIIINFLDEEDLFEILDEDNEYSICPYCGNPNFSDDPDLLCPDCQEIFNHIYIQDL